MSSGNFLFLLLMIMGPLVAVSSSNWLICWVGVELSFIGLIPLLFMSSSYSSLSKESSMKYFCIQALGSGLLLCGGILFYMVPGNFGIMPELVFLVSLIIKLGVFPMHFWVPGVVSGLGWVSMFLLLTWQKFPPLFFLVSLSDSSTWLEKPVLLLGGVTAIVGALIGLNQTKIAPMLGASSIAHTGWLLVALMYGNVWTYLILYCITFIFVISFLTVEDSFMSGLGIFSLSGLPPFLLFLGKLVVVKASLFFGMSYWYLCLPLLSSIVSLFFYLKYFYSFYLEGGENIHSKFSLWLCLSLLSFVGVGVAVIL